MILGRLHARPLAWVAAVAAAAWPLGGPGTAVMAAYGALARGETLDAASLSDGLWGLAALAPAIVLPRAALGLVAWVALAGLSLDAADDRGWGSDAAMRLVRTRGIGSMAGSFVLGIPLYACAAMLQYDTLPVLATLGIAFLLATATAWLTMSDRFALRRFDGAQDRRARDDIDARWNAPYYLNTGVPGKRLRSVATGADQAVTDGGAALLSVRGVALVVVWLLLDTLRALAAASLGAWAGWAVGAEGALVASALWTHAFYAPTEKAGA